MPVAICLAAALMMPSSLTQAQLPAELVIRNGLIVNENGRMAVAGRH